MGRAVASMKLIESKRARENMYKKRGTSLKKKAMELSILCNVDLCMIMVSDTGAVQTWPEDDPEKMKAVMESHKTAATSSDKSTKCKHTTVSDIIQGWIKTKEEDLAKVKAAITEAKYPTSGEIYRDLPEENRRELANILTAKIDEVKQKTYEISMNKASHSANFTNNPMDLLPPNHGYVIHQNPMYCNTMQYNNGGVMFNQFVQPEIYSTCTSTSVNLQQPEHYMMMQQLYGGGDGGVDQRLNFPAAAMQQAELQWMGYQYQSEGTSPSDSNQFQDHIQVAQMEHPYNME